MAYRWCQKNVFEPFPTAMFVPLWTTSILLRIPRHVFEALVFSLNISMSNQLSQYLALRTLEHKDSGSDKTLHPSLAIKAELACLIDLIPSPPFFFVFAIVSQATRWTRLFPSCSPHKKLRVSRSISSHVVRGNFVDCIA